MRWRYKNDFPPDKWFLINLDFGMIAHNFGVRQGVTFSWLWNRVAITFFLETFHVILLNQYFMKCSLSHNFRVGWEDFLVILDLGKFLIIAKSDGGHFLIIFRSGGIFFFTPKRGGEILPPPPTIWEKREKNECPLTLFSYCWGLGGNFPPLSGVALHPIWKLWEKGTFHLMPNMRKVIFHSLP